MIALLPNVGNSQSGDSPKLAALPIGLETAITYHGSGTSIYEKDAIPLHAPPGSDPKTFVNSFDIEYGALRTFYCNAKQKDGFGRLIRNQRSGFDGTNYFTLFEPQLEMLMSADRQTASDRFLSLLSNYELLTLPFAFVSLPSVKNPETPAERDLADIRRALVLLQERLGQNQEKAQKVTFDIKKDDSTIWTLIMADNNLYPLESKLSLNGKPAMILHVMEWGERHGPMQFPRRLQLKEFAEGQLAKTTEFTVNDLKIGVRLDDVKAPFESAKGILDVDIERPVPNGIRK